jgi:hypothetical protein
MKPDTEHTSQTPELSEAKETEEITAENMVIPAAEDCDSADIRAADADSPEEFPGEYDAAIQAELQAKIAEFVRLNARETGAITDIDDLGELALEIEAELFSPLITAMVRDGGEYADIKLAVAAEGAPYLFSEEYLAPDAAIAQAEALAVRRTIAEKVRSDSQGDPIKLTSRTTLQESLPAIDEETLQAHLTAMAAAERYSDIQRLLASTGEAFYFSEAFMTRTYASILVRAEVNDPKATIVETVRDESRVYPRPTRIDLFDAQVFGIDSDKLDMYVQEILEREEYNDIAKIVSSVDTVWLYSKRYMIEDQARAHVEWEEVEQHEWP